MGANGSAMARRQSLLGDGREAPRKSRNRDFKMPEVEQKERKPSELWGKARTASSAVAKLAGGSNSGGGGASVPVEDNFVAKPGCLRILEDDDVNAKAPGVFTVGDIMSWLQTPPSDRNDVQSSGLARVLEATTFFKRFPKKITSELGRLVVLQRLPKDQPLYQKGEPAKGFHIILQGFLEMYLGHQVEKKHLYHTLTRGHTVGETALLQQELRPVSAVVSGSCWLMTLYRKDFVRVKSSLTRESLMDQLRLAPAERKEKHVHMFEGLTASLEFFKGLSETIRKEVAAALVHMAVPLGQDVFCQGDDGDLFYIMLDGHADVLIGSANAKPKLVNTVLNGASFGELALLHPDGKRGATIRCRTDCHFLTLSRASYVGILMAEQQRAMNQVKHFLITVFPPLKLYPDQSVASYTKYYDPVFLAAGSTLVAQGDAFDTLYFVVSGECKCTLFVEFFKTKSRKSTQEKATGELMYVVDKIVRCEREIVLASSVSAGDCLGELVMWSASEAWWMNVIAISEVHLLKITRQNFVKYMSANLLTSLRDNALPKFKNYCDRAHGQVALFSERGWKLRDNAPHIELPIVRPPAPPAKKEKVMAWERIQSLRTKRIHKDEDDEEEEGQAKASQAVPKVEDPNAREYGDDQDLPEALQPVSGELQRSFGFYFRQRVGDGRGDMGIIRKGKAIPQTTAYQMEIQRKEQEQLQAEKGGPSIPEVKKTARVLQRLEMKLEQYRFHKHLRRELQNRIRARRQEGINSCHGRDFHLENLVIAREFLREGHTADIKTRTAEKTERRNRIFEHHKQLEQQREEQQLANMAHCEQMAEAVKSRRALYTAEKALKGQLARNRSSSRCKDQSPPATKDVPVDESPPSVASPPSATSADDVPSGDDIPAPSVSSETTSSRTDIGERRVSFRLEAGHGGEDDMEAKRTLPLLVKQKSLPPISVCEEDDELIATPSFDSPLSVNMGTPTRPTFLQNMKSWVG